MGNYLNFGVIGSAVAAPEILDYETSTGTGTSITAISPGGIQADELLVIIVSYGQNSGIYRHVHPSTPAGWTKMGESQIYQSANTVFWKIATGSEGNIGFTVDSSSSASVMRYFRISGFDPDEPIGSLFYDVANATSSISGTITAARPNTLAILTAATSKLTTLTITAGGFTKLEETSSSTIVDSMLATRTLESAGNAGTISAGISGGNDDMHLSVLAINPLTEDAYSGPIIEAYQKTLGLNSGNSFTAVAPSGITAGELLVVCITTNDFLTGDIYNTPTGWTKALEAGPGDGDARCVVFYRQATGGEGNVNFTTSTSLTSRDWVGWYCRVSGAAASSPVDSVNEFGNGNLKTFHKHNALPATTTENCLVFVLGSLAQGQVTLDPVLYGDLVKTLDFGRPDTNSSGLTGVFGAIHAVDLLATDVLWTHWNDSSTGGHQCVAGAVAFKAA